MRELLMGLSALPAYSGQTKRLPNGFSRGPDTGRLPASSSMPAL